MSASAQFTTVTIAGEGANLLNPQVMADVSTALRAADGDAGCAGIILTGQGDAFCGGLDVAALRNGGDPVEFATSLVELLKIFPTLSKPVAARVNGDAVASGASLVAACDYAVSVPGARIGTYEVSVGIWPMVAQVPIIKRLGVRAALENIAAGEPFTAARAREVGLVNEVTSDDKLDDLILRWLTQTARGGTAIAAGRPSAYLLDGLPYDEALDRSLSMFAAMFDK